MTAIPGDIRAHACDRAGVLYPPGVKVLPEDVETSALIGSLADGWRFDVEAIDYAAVGFGSYHWVATDPRGTRRFVTVGDLEQKPWLGDTRETVFDGLMRAFDTAVALRDAGLGFLVDQVPARTRRRLAIARMRRVTYSPANGDGVRRGASAPEPPSGLMAPA